MRKTYWMLAALSALVTAPTLSAQGPGRGPAVEFLLARTGTLQLSDQQVVKLAAIARRAADRHKTMHASFDSLRTQFRRGHDSSGRMQFMGAFQKEREAEHTDLRDAIAVLTPDQQARAWELVSERRMHHRMFGPRRDGRDGHAGPRARSGPTRGGRADADPSGNDDEQDAPGAASR
jgi:hypothetical protein